MLLAIVLNDGRLSGASRKHHALYIPHARITILASVRDLGPLGLRLRMDGRDGGAGVGVLVHQSFSHLLAASSQPTPIPVRPADLRGTSPSA